MNVAFINENTLGHASYLMPFVRRLRERPDFDVIPHVINATPLPADLVWRAHFSVRGVRKWGLDFQNARWRMTVSRFVRTELDSLRARCPIDAVVANTQSVALELADLDRTIPLFVCLDATFEQLSRSPWFAPNRGTRLFLPITTAAIRKRERALFARADRLLAWSESARQSFVQDYGRPREQLYVLPPSVHSSPVSGTRTAGRARVLFIGGDFHRKGGELLLECYRKWFRDTCDLHILTQSAIPEEPGVHVHRGVQQYSAEWCEQWQSADVFVFPSRLETFGIVLLEAMSFGVPVISADVGAARELLGDGRAGWLLEERTPEAIAQALREVLADAPAARRRALEGRTIIESRFDLSRNTEQLVKWLQQAASPQPAAAGAQV